MWTIKVIEHGFVLIVDGEEYPFHNYDGLLTIIETNNIENGIEILNFFIAFYPEPERVCICIMKTANGTIYGYRNNTNGAEEYVVIDNNGYIQYFQSINEAMYCLNPGLNNGR